MAGRGRGSQFASISDGLGLGRGRMDLQNADPPPVYPPLGSRPHYPQMLPENDYMLAVMKDFTNQMRDSQFAISASDNDSYNKGIVIERFSDKPQGFIQKPLVGIDWRRFPKELCPSSETKKSKRKGGTASKPNLVSKKAKVKVNPDDILNKLEQAEKNGANEDEDGNEGSDVEGSDKEDDNVENKNEENLDSDEIDEELDEGTDYANNFFDNGENYLDDEDDNLDEGGIY